MHLLAGKESAFVVILCDLHDIMSAIYKTISIEKCAVLAELCRWHRINGVKLKTNHILWCFI